MPHPVSLHISLSPGDLPHARHILPHQLRAAASHVSEVVLTVDGVEPDSPDLGTFFELAEPFRPLCDVWQIRVVDHTEPHRRALSQNVFNSNRPLPRRTYRRGPCAAYFGGWATTTQPYVFHLDSDMFIGGNLDAWLASSIAVLEASPRVMACNPLPGPPRPDGSINQPDLGPMPGVQQSHTFAHFTSRIFLARRADLVAPQPPLTWSPAPLRLRLRAWLEGLPDLDLPENLFTKRMQTLHQVRLDHPGDGSPAFSMHPPHRNDEFYRRLSKFVSRVERNDFPDGQRGCYDLNKPLIDWSEQIAALSQQRWWKVLLRRLTSKRSTPAK